MKEDPEVMLNLSLENAVQRNLDVAFDNSMKYSRMMAENSGRGWKLLALILSADRRFRDAETILEFALDEASRMDQLELLRLQAVLQSSDCSGTAQASNRNLPNLDVSRSSTREAQSSNFVRAKSSDTENVVERNMKMAAWQDLATIYTRFGLWPDAEICLDKAKSIEFHSPKSWHTTGLLFEARSLYKEALVSFSVSLSIEPDDVPSIVSTAALLRQFGGQSLPIAKSFLMNALRLDPTSHDAWMNLGLITKTEGSLQLAADFFQAAYELMLSAPVEAFTRWWNLFS